MRSEVDHSRHFKNTRNVTDESDGASIHFSTS